MLKFDRFTLTLGGLLGFVSSEVRDLLAKTTDSGSDSAFSPRIGLTYEFIPGMAAYGGYSRSFRAQINVTNLFDREYFGASYRNV